MKTKAEFAVVLFFLGSILPVIVFITTYLNYTSYLNYRELVNYRNNPLPYPHYTIFQFIFYLLFHSVFCIQVFLSLIQGVVLVFLHKKYVVPGKKFTLSASGGLIFIFGLLLIINLLLWFGLAFCPPWAGSC